MEVVHENVMNDFRMMFVAVFCLYFGQYHRKIQGLEKKKWIGTSMGLVLIVFLMGADAWHHILAGICSIILMRTVNKENCHKVNTVFYFSYATAYRMIDPGQGWNSQKHIEVNLMMMFLLVKSVGLSFEIHNSHKKARSKENMKNGSVGVEGKEEILDPDFMEIFHYLFTFMGTLTGPYYRYRTYDDYLKLPMAQAVSSTDYYKRKLLTVFMSSAAYALLTIIWPLEQLQDTDFYSSSYLYKFFFGMVQLQRFRLFMFGGIVMAEAVSSAAGMGAYPVECKNKCGHGPTKNYEQLKKLTLEEAKTLQYDFETVNCVDINVLYTTPWLKVYTESWNKSIQYFMGQYFYLGLFNEIPNKTLGVLLTWMVCAIWHGMEAGYFVCCAMIAFYTMAERKYYKMYLQTSGVVSQIFICFMYMMYTQIYSHAIVTFLVLDHKIIWRYGASMYYIPYISLGLFYFLSDPLLNYVTNIKKALKEIQ